MAAWWAAMSLFCFGFTQKSLDTVTKSEDIQATQQLNSTNEPGDERKAASQPEVFAGKSKWDRKYQTSWERDFPWLVHDEEKNTMKCKICCFFPKLQTNLHVAPCSLETVRSGVLPFRPMLKVKLTSNVLKQTLLGKTQVPHLWEQCYEIWTHKSKKNCKSFSTVPTLNLKGQLLFGGTLPREQDDPSLWGINNKVMRNVLTISYSYFMPSKLWKQCPRLNIEFNHD